MRLSIIGCGYVGIVTGVCLANSGHKVYIYDKDRQKISNFKAGKNLIFEKNLKSKLKSAIRNKKIFFPDTLEDSIKKSDATFVCVGTPLKNKNINLNYIKVVTAQLARLVKVKKNFSIIYKSTIPPLTVEKICLPILKKKLGKRIDQNTNIIFNPEFLREGSAIYDFENPVRIIAGIRNNKSKQIIEKIYKKYKKKSKLIFVNIKTAEFIKYYSNSFFSLLISHSNEISNLCYNLGIDYIDVLNAFKLDSRMRVNNKVPEVINYMVPGIGYGGSCFPKDIKTFIKFAKNKNFNLSILKNVDKINDLQPRFISRIILKNFIKKRVKSCLILGLTFKENTDDIRSSTSIDLANILAKTKIKIYVHDPIFTKKLFIKNKRLFNNKIICLEKINFMKKYDSIVVNNISKEYKKIIKFYDTKYNSLIFDSRRAFGNVNLKNYFGSSLNIT